MTKPGFVLKRTQLIFSRNNPIEQGKIYKNYIYNRNKNNNCYCGHTFTCDCGDPSFEEFKHNLLNNNIEEKYLI
jgi:hypothetical protein